MSTIARQTLVQTMALVLMVLENLNATVGLVTQVGKAKFNYTYFIKSSHGTLLVFSLFDVYLHLVPPRLV